MIIKCFNPITLECFDVLTRASSVIWNKKFLEVGSFEIHTDKCNLKKLDIIQHGNNAGIVMKITKTFEETAIYGYDLRGLTAFRYLFGEQSRSGNVESIIKGLATECLMTGERAIQHLTIAEDKKRGENITLTTKDKLLSECFSEIISKYSLGYEITLSDNGFLFDVVVPQDRTQTTVFSRKLHNVEELEYDNDLLETYNIVYYSDESGSVQQVGQATGIFRRESGTDKPEEAEQFLIENAEIETLRGTANDKLQYGIDWNIGDFVTVRFEDLETVKQITEAEIVFEPANNRVIPIFGEERENPIKKIIQRS